MAHEKPILAKMRSVGVTNLITARLLAGVADNAYRTKCPALRANLRDPRNPGLRARVLKGDLSPTDLVAMRVEELASPVRGNSPE